MRPSPTTSIRQNRALLLVLKHAGLGAALGLVFVALLLALDAHGLWTLMRGSDSGIVAFLLLAGGFMVTFGSLVAGGAIMMIGSDESGPPDGGRPAVLVPVPVRVRSRRPSAPVQRDLY